MKTESLSLHEARARALAAQGFDRKRLKVDAKALARVVAATQLFQIDSVSVVIRAHYLPLFSRLGSGARSIDVSIARRSQFGRVIGVDG